MTQEALKLVLQTLELSKETMESARKQIDELKAENKALKEALAQPQQEPFGYFKAEPFGWTDCAETDEGAIALYEAPSQRTWVGLTDEERIDILVDAVHTKWDDQEIIKAIEAKLKEKNAFAEDSSVTEQNICPKCRSFFCDHTCKTNPEEKNNA
jgi:hypothetical protein